MTMKTLSTVATLALLALGRPALAQDTTAAPSPSRVRAAEELVASMDMERNYARTMDAMIDQQKRSNPMVGQYEQVMRDFFAKYIGWEQVKPDFVRIYAETYTEDEMRQLGDFYRTPLGRRLLETQPQLSARSAELTQNRIMAHMPELMQQMMSQAAPPARP
jgi:hypothetical protein